MLYKNPSSRVLKNCENVILSPSANSG